MFLKFPEKLFFEKKIKIGKISAKKATRQSPKIFKISPKNVFQILKNFFQISRKNFHYSVTILPSINLTTPPFSAEFSAGGFLKREKMPPVFSDFSEF